MRIILSILFTAFVTLASAQEQKPTTFIVVRHAEKVSDGSKDPELSPEGSERARRLARMLKDVHVSAIYSTDFKRTQNTVGPLATEKSVQVQRYASLTDADITTMLKQFPGGTIVIAAHSNTAPSIANLLSGTNAFSDFADTEYDNLIIVTVLGKERSVIRLHY